MTQIDKKIYKAASITSFVLFCLTILEIQTILLFLITLYLSYKYVSMLINRQIQKGLLQLLPSSIQHNLLHRSLFDLICDIWFQESIGFIKLLFRPLLVAVQPDNAIQALHDFHPNSRSKFLLKGIVKIMPKTLQQILLGRQRMNYITFNQLIKVDTSPIVKIMALKQSQKSTNSQSVNIKKLFRSNSMKQIKGSEKVCKQQARSDNKINKTYRAVEIAKWDKLELYRKKNIKQPKHLNIIKNAQTYIQMVKKIIQIKNLAGQLQRVNTGTVLKCSIMFWVVLLLQMKVNTNARRMVIKTLYIMASIISVLGVLGTTGILIYKHGLTEDIQTTRQQIDNKGYQS